MRNPPSTMQHAVLSGRVDRERFNQRSFSTPRKVIGGRGFSFWSLFTKGNFLVVENSVSSFRTRNTFCPSILSVQRIFGEHALPRHGSHDVSTFIDVSSQPPLAGTTALEPDDFVGVGAAPILRISVATFQSTRYALSTPDQGHDRRGTSIFIPSSAQQALRWRRLSRNNNKSLRLAKRYSIHSRE